MTETIQDQRAGNFAECGALARTGDYDRWLASLFMPADKRPYVHSLLAFNLEIANVRDLVSEPRLGEIRLQWWRDALEGRRDEAKGHPVAASLLETIDKFRLPIEPFIGLIDARVFDLWNDPAPDLAWLEGYCGETSSSLFRLISLILAEGADPGGANLAGHAGLAWAFAGLLRALPWHARSGRVYIPSDLLQKHGSSAGEAAGREATSSLLAALSQMRAETRRHLQSVDLRSLPTELRLAFAPLSLVENYLKRMERRNYAPFATEINLPAWRKIAAFWTAVR